MQAATEELDEAEELERGQSEVQLHSFSPIPHCPSPQSVHMLVGAEVGHFPVCGFGTILARDSRPEQQGSMFVSEMMPPSGRQEGEDRLLEDSLELCEEEELEWKEEDDEAISPTRTMRTASVS